MLAYVRYPDWIHPEIFFWLKDKSSFLGNIRWYGMMYVVAFAVAYALFKYQNKREKIKLTETHSSGFFFAVIIGLLLGGRLFSVLIYDTDRSFYLTHPWLIFWPFKDGKLVGLQGMSYHGGVVGTIAGMLYYTWRHKIKFRRVADMACAGIPLGYTFGRLGNFINGELWGRVAKSGHGMIFWKDAGASTDASLPWAQELAAKLDIQSQWIGGENVFFLPRHPSQLYEAFFEGIFIWLILWFIFRKHKPFDGFVSGMYVLLYGVVRFAIEYFRQPDEQLGFIWGNKDADPQLLESFANISMGQILCLLMVLGGIGLILFFKFMDMRDKKLGLERSSVYLPGADLTEKPKKDSLFVRAVKMAKESKADSKDEKSAAEKNEASATNNSSRNKAKRKNKKKK